MIALDDLLFALVAVLAVMVVLEQRPERQIISYSIFGVALALLFFCLQAPDVALSEVAVGSLVVPLVVLTTIAKRRGDQCSSRDR
jgi:energy-converting hydrogenase B subunit D